MKRHYTVPALFFSVLLLLSFSTNPPTGKTGAPGESFCTECHTPPSQSLDGSISVEGFPSVISPNETYTLTVVNRNTVGDAVRAGFQMTVLGPTNTRAGDFSNPSPQTAISVGGGRQYFAHNPAPMYPDSHVVRWTVDWTAPDLPPGSEVTWYAAGNITNGNFNSTGDRVVGANGKGTYVLSSTREPNAPSRVAVYPNPGRDELIFSLENSLNQDGVATFINSQGQAVLERQVQNGRTAVPDLAPGLYLVRLTTADGTYLARWTRL